LQNRRRVVITGLGAVTPLGNTLASFWDGLVAGRSGIAPITAFDSAKLTTHIAGEVKGFDPDALIGRRDARRMDRYAQFAFVAAREALADANFPEDKALRDRTGAVVASGIGGIITVEETVAKVSPGMEWDRISPFFVPMLMSNAAPAHISMAYKLRGPVYSVASACASSNDALAIAYRAIAYGQADAMVTGGSEATIIPTAMGGFCSMKAFSTRNDEPERASRPFDRDRDGFVLAEGAAILVFEERDAAIARGARIYGEFLGAGQSADAYNLVAVDPTGSGVTLAMERALDDAGLAKEQIGYINAHGTSTPIGDPAESKAIEILFGAHAKKLAVSSTKSMHGHALGAAGALEGVATTLALYHGILPPTINLENPDPECTLDYVPNIARKAQVQYAMSNGFGFGGHNATVVLGRHE
jgi:3-oxoacyl-[acyl-carrier-protein] synthase II